MAYKIKAALQGRQNRFTGSKQRASIAPIELVNLTGGGILPTDLDDFNCRSGTHFNSVFGSQFALHQPFGSIPCLRSSSRANSLNQLPRLIPDLAAASSSCSRSSGEIRIWNVGDLPETDCLVSRLIVDMYVPTRLGLKHSGTYPSIWEPENKTPSKGIRSTKRGLTKPLSEVTIMADIQSTQTRPKYHFRFLALDRANRKAAPCCISVDASSEREARSILAPYFILSLAAKLPVCGENPQTDLSISKIEMVEGMAQITTPLTSGKTPTVQEVRHA